MKKRGIFFHSSSSWKIFSSAFLALRPTRRRSRGFGGSQSSRAMSTAVRWGLARERRKTFLSKRRDVERGRSDLRHSPPPSLINPSLQELRYSTFRYTELFPNFEKNSTLSASINYGFLLTNGQIMDATTKTHYQQE
ncbi:hypothetical protein AVEN_163480-1 [Araneus ventricosus]|uniref:Uncharacterized protein n=1 Tax=Araneus ventricosus TaxID=182803 RepID=A0A4Y2BQ09_ARAVE|nr:hypothetical protein AVEN_163480-1 [Araneus ventricosus]